MGLKAYSTVCIRCASLRTGTFCLYFLHGEGIFLCDLLFCFLWLIANDSFQFHLYFANFQGFSDLERIGFSMLDHSPQDLILIISQGCNFDLLVWVLRDFVEGKVWNIYLLRFENMIIDDFDCFSKVDQKGSVLEDSFILLNCRFMKIKQLV